MEVGDSDCVILGRTTLFKLLMANTELHECGRFWILLLLPLLKILDFRHQTFHIAQEDVADSFHIGQLVNVFPYIFKFFSIELFCSHIFNHFELHIVKTTLAVSCWVRSCCTKCKSPHSRYIFHIL